MLVNGKPADSVSAADRGLNYGDGLFETLAVAAGKPRLWDLHLARLHEGCRRLAIPPPKPDLLLQESHAVAGTIGDGVLKLILTRGAAGRGYKPPAQAQPTRILAAHSAPLFPSSYWSEGIRVRFCCTALGENPALAGIKHLNRLEQVLARLEWDDTDVVEGLMRDRAGRVIEATACNLFLLRDGELLTPDLSRCGVAGVMRAFLLETARAEGLEPRIADIDRADVLAADAVFLTNALVGIWPVRHLQDREYDVSRIPAGLTAAARENSLAVAG